MIDEAIRPGSEANLCDAIADAASRGDRLAIRGGGSKRDVGRAVDARVLDMSGFVGVLDYDPAELVLTVRPGTPLAEVQRLVAGQNQMLAFEPLDSGPLFGRPAGAATIGGVVAAGLAGSQRLSSGGARDHLLGCRAVSGRGELFVSGAKVVKNVTGYDLPKLIAGSWGQVAAITEITLKVLPAPRVVTTRILKGLDPERAVAAMAAALGSQADVAAAAHLPGETPITAFRLQGFQASVAARCETLTRRLEGYGRLECPDDGAGIWESLRTLSPLPPDRPLWRVSVPPSAGGEVVRRIEAAGGQWLLDWAGGLGWIVLEDHNLVRQIASEAGGHAMLLRAPAEMRAQVPAFHPQPKGLAALEERVRRAFDPNSVFETGRF